MLDCGTRTMQGYEAGRCTPPLSTIRKMMDLYRCEFADLYPDDVEYKPPPNGSSRIDWVTQLLSYRAPMSVEEVRIYSSAREKSGFYVCPRCNATMESEFILFCGCCGQRLNWSSYRKARMTYVGGT